MQTNSSTESLDNSFDELPDIFEFVGSDEEEDEVLTWEDLSVGKYKVSLPSHKIAVWESSMLMAEWIIQNPDFVKGKTVMELGCGLGLPSIAAALSGAKSVLATDMSQKAISELEQAAAYNATKYPALRTISGGILDWCEADKSPFPKVDVIIAADVNYNRAFVKPLTNAILRHRTASTPLYLATRLGRVSLPEALESLSQNLTLRNKTNLYSDDERTHVLFHFD
eukprot:TRINITY_DN21027_c0_g1_i1.p1 TRINITY_DN21027_c0_g1~~TRINITY_DN21027_c0_g1_i1.p1  ORF type:complete len:241 (+),score=52.40 TRINITY_DN21027_c0_g1_i1:49-723(+)